MEGLVSPFVADVIVLTQACDLEQNHVDNVVLCPHVLLSSHREYWEESEHERGQNPTAKGWRNHCDDIKGGFAWNLCFLRMDDSIEGLKENRVVEFREIFTAPRDVLERFLREQNKKRPQLVQPYREHVSQAFARFFMRVGLPTEVPRTWNS